MSDCVVEVVELRGNGGLGVFLRVGDDQRLFRVAPVRDPNQPRFWCLAVFACSACGIPESGTAIWAGASIHEVAQVIAAASLIGAGGATVLATATTVKLARVALLAPVQLVSARICRSEDVTRRGPLVPLFLVGFLAAVAIRSTGVLPQVALDLASSLTTVLLSAAMFGLGTGIVARHLWPVPVRVLVLATISTLVAAGVALGLVTQLV